jgi:hypothetical protein
MKIQFDNSPITHEINSPVDEINNNIAQSKAMAHLLCDSLDEDAEKNTAWALIDKIESIEVLFSTCMKSKT